MFQESVMPDQQPQSDANQDNAGDQQPDTGQQDQGGQDQGKSGDSGQSGTPNTGGDDGQDSSKDNGPTLEEQLDAAKRENIRLKRAADARKEDEEAKKNNEDEAAKELRKLKADNARMSGFMQTTFMENAILKDKKYEWQNVEDVRAFIRDENISIGEDGKVDGLDLELKRIAKDKPYLLVPKKQDDGQGEGNQPPSGRQVTGQQPRGGSSRTGQLDRDKLKSKYKIGSPFRAV